MSHASEGNPEESTHGFQFPGDFVITAMGQADGDLASHVLELLQAADFDLHRQTLSQRPSSKGNYVAVRIQVHCPTREHYERAHAILRADPAIHFTL